MYTLLLGCLPALLLLAAPARAQVHAFADPASVQAYSEESGRGFEGAPPPFADGGVQDQRPFLYLQDVPAEGNYRVTVTLGGADASSTTIHAELHRLAFSAVEVPAGGSRTVTFIVNVRTPALPDGRAVQLKAPRETIAEAAAWDRRISVEFSGTAPAVRAIGIEAVAVPTIYLLGDSTVADQRAGPYASWGQMLPALFQPTVAIANHSQSGESLSGAIGALRVEKILSLLRPGDMMLVQFGHNDQKQRAADPENHLRYRDRLVELIAAVKARGAVPVVVTSMYRHRFDGDQVVDTLEPYPEMARIAAREGGACLIDLHAMSETLYESFGAEGSKSLFKQEEDGTGLDRTHHGPYGAMQLAKAVALGLRQNQVPLAAALGPGFGYDPAHPDPPGAYVFAPGYQAVSERPLGD